VVRTLQFTAVGAFLERFHAKRVMAATHVALGGRSFSFGNSHVAPVLEMINRFEKPAA
jgi:hypothetical protein